jgi:hypothetical protein
MAYCEENGVGDVLGLTRNARLEKEVQESIWQAKARLCLCGSSVRIFKVFEYQTKESWSRSRRVIGKAEVTLQGANPRFVVTSIQEENPASVYEER